MYILSNEDDQINWMFEISVKIDNKSMNVFFFNFLDNFSKKIKIFDLV
jgi:hypothetical protein